MALVKFGIADIQTLSAPGDGSVEADYVTFYIPASDYPQLDEYGPSVPGGDGMPRYVGKPSFTVRLPAMRLTTNLVGAVSTTDNFKKAQALYRSAITNANMRVFINYYQPRTGGFVKTPAFMSFISWGGGRLLGGPIISPVEVRFSGIGLPLSTTYTGGETDPPSDGDGTAGTGSNSDNFRHTWGSGKWGSGNWGQGE